MMGRNNMVAYIQACTGTAICYQAFTNKTFVTVHTRFRRSIFLQAQRTCLTATFQVFLLYLFWNVLYLFVCFRVLHSTRINYLMLQYAKEKKIEVFLSKTWNIYTEYTRVFKNCCNMPGDGPLSLMWNWFMSKQRLQRWCVWWREVKWRLHK